MYVHRDECACIVSVWVVLHNPKKSSKKLHRYGKDISSSFNKSREKTTSWTLTICRQAEPLTEAQYVEIGNDKIYIPSVCLQLLYSSTKIRLGQ